MVSYILKAFNFFERVGIMQECKIGLKDYIAQAEGNIVSDMDGEKVMLSIKNGKYYNLGTIGGVIWDHLQKPILLEELISKLQNELPNQFDVFQRLRLIEYGYVNQYDTKGKFFQ